MHKYGSRIIKKYSKISKKDKHTHMVLIQIMLCIKE